MPRPDTRPYEVTQPLSRRDRVRAEAVAQIPWWYNPWGHLAFPSLVGLGLIAGAVALLERPSAWELLTVPVVFVLVNLNEWRIHKYMLHRPSWPLEILFWRHTPEHHVIFIRDDMAMRERREFRLVLIPFYGILASFLKDCTGVGNGYFEVQLCRVLLQLETFQIRLCRLHIAFRFAYGTL